MARKKLTVLDFAIQISAASDPIPVKVKAGFDTIAEAKSLNWLASHGAVGVLESRITFVTITHEEITVYVKC